MGSHPSGPSVLFNNPERFLTEIISKTPTVLGSEVKKKFGLKLPFLFKVLSIKKALSIQAHPNKVIDLMHLRLDFLNDSF